MNQELIQELAAGNIAVENTGTLEQLQQVIKQAYPKDRQVPTGEEEVYYTVFRGLWGGVPKRRIEKRIVPIQDFFK